MVNINNVAIFTTFKNQLDYVHILIKMHHTSDQDMGNKAMLIQNFHEQNLVPLSPRVGTMDKG